MLPSEKNNVLKELTVGDNNQLETPVPQEVLEQYYGPAISTLSQAVLAARSAELRDRLVKSPNDAATMHALGSVIHRQGNVKEAVALWTAANKLDANQAPGDVMRDVQEVFALLAKGDKADAQKKLLAAETRHTNQPHFHLLRGEQAMRGGNLKAAEQAFRRAYELAPQLYVTNLNLARFNDATRRDTAMAERLYQAAAKLAPRRAEVWANLGAFQYRQKQPKLALESLRRARALDPAYPIPEKRLAELSSGMGDQAAASEWYLAALSTKPAPEEEQAIRTALGDVLLRLGKLDAARKQIETVLKKRELPPLLFALATIDEAQGRLDMAEKRYRRVLELMPDNPLPANNLAMLLIRSGKFGDEPLKLAQQAKRFLPDNAIVESTWGCALGHVGRNSEAVTVLRPVVKAVPGDAWAHYCLGKSLLLEKNAKEAKLYLSRVMQLDAKFPLRVQVEKMLAGLP